jgi:hypothetical protein
MDPRHGIPDRRRAAALGADLQYLARARHGVNHQSPLAEIVATWLFDINMLSGIQGKNCRGCVPVVGRRDPDRVHALIVEYLAEIAHALGCTSRIHLDIRDGSSQAATIHIADISDIHVTPRGEKTEMVAPHPTRANQADGDFLLRRSLGLDAAKGESRCAHDASFKDRSARNSSHRGVSHA